MVLKEGVAALSDDSVQSKTGKTWEDWFSILDAFEGPKKGHKLMAKFLSESHGVGAWWSQTITVQYERARGMREENQRSAGFAVSVSRTVKTSIERAWNAWADPAELNRWFTTGATQDFREGGRYANNDKDQGSFKRIVPMKRILFTWEQPQHRPGSVVEVSFLAKAPDKVGVVLTHEKLGSKEEVENLREGWSWALDSLKSYLETGASIPWERWKEARG